MATYEAIFFWITLVVYALVGGGYIYAFVFNNERVLAKLYAMLGVGFALHTMAIAARTIAQGHLPWTGDYENGLMGGWYIVAATLYVTWRQKPLRALSMATVPFSMLLMGYGVMRNPRLEPMSARLDEMMFRYLVFGFITDAIMIAAGAIWAKDLWGRYWGWDPLETWSLVSWLIYGVSIHLRITMGWRGVRFAWLMIMALISVVIVFFGVNFMSSSTLHMFNVR